MTSYQPDDSVQTVPQTPRKSGVYGLFRLDGGPVDPRDAAALGLVCPQSQVSGLLEAIDRENTATARLDEDGVVTEFAGMVSDQAVQAAELGLAADSSMARIARAALARFGAETPARLIGEWSLLQWDRQDRTVTVMGSAGRRDPVCFARRGAHLAIAPDLFALGRIDWVDTDLDQAVLLLSVGRAGLRKSQGMRTIYRGASRLANGAGVVFSQRAVPLELRGDVFAQPPRGSGSIDDALEQSEALLLKIMRERLTMAGSAAVLLSGGLDSTLLACAANDARRAGTDLRAYTSALPPGSTGADEMPHAGLVAAMLGLAHQPIVPDPTLDSFRPGPMILGGGNAPPLVNRHCLTETFQQTARNHGTRLLINGTYGEATLTARLPVGGLRAELRGLARRLLGRADPTGAITKRNAFHVRLASDLLNHLPAEIEAELDHQAGARSASVDTDGLFGFLNVAPKALAHANEFYAGAVRMDFPFRDMRLLRHFAALPIEVVRMLGADRGAGRRILAGRVPDAIAQRRTGLPADPDHYARLQRQAPLARNRIAAFRKAGLDALLDLDWLDAQLATIANQGVNGVVQANQIQLTAIFAEFMLWLQDGAVVSSSRA